LTAEEARQCAEAALPVKGLTLVDSNEERREQRTDEYNRDLSPQEVDHAAALVRAVRDAVGPAIGLAIDCHWNYNVDAAIALARAVEPFRLLWLEDPVPPENIRAIGEVQRNTRT